MRLSLSLLPKEKADALWKEQNDEKVSEDINELERIAYDFCTDAMCFITGMVMLIIWWIFQPIMN